ncbi:MAG: sulfatase [Myxococcales bacterium]|nr:sulfatase [Myxococcales bacterium]
MQNQFIISIRTTIAATIGRHGVSAAVTALACLGLGLVNCGEGDPPLGSTPPPAPLEASRARPLPRVELASTPSILLISVDTLRSDHLSLFGYPRNTTPSIDRYFADATVYRAAYSAEANTSPSVISMLSGLLPARHRVRMFYQRIPAKIHLLSDYLSAAGYQTAAVVSNVVLTREAIGLSTRFGHYDDFVDEREQSLDVYERRASRTSDAAIKWLRELRDPERPHLLWVHYIDPHGPYRPPVDSPIKDFQHLVPQPIDSERIISYQRLAGVDDGAEYIDRYDEEIAYADAEIGRLLSAYDELGLSDSSIVVFTADHGENLIEHDVYFNHGHQVWNSIMRVPLMIRTPGGKADQIDVPVSLVDLTPTLLALVGYPSPEDDKTFDGIQLSKRRPEDSISLEASGYAAKGDQWVYWHHRALVSGSDKWFASVDREGKVVARGYFDLARDPGEQRPEAWRFGAKANRLLDWFETDPDPAGVPESVLNGQRLLAPKVAPGRTSDELRALRALGYVE